MNIFSISVNDINKKKYVVSDALCSVMPEEFQEYFINMKNIQKVETVLNNDTIIARKVGE